MSISPPSAETLKALETVPNMYLVLSPELYILTASDSYLEATQTSRENIVGKHIFEAFPNNPNQPELDGVAVINFSLQEVLRTKKPHSMPVVRYDVPDINAPGQFIQKYWLPNHSPVLKEGEIQYIIQTANDITEQILAEQALLKSRDELVTLNKELNVTVAELGKSKLDLESLNNLLEAQIVERTQSLAETASSLHSLIMNARYPLMILRGEDWTVEIANPEMGKLWDKSLSEITGRPLLTILPEINDQPFPGLLKRVWDTGTSYGQEEQVFYLDKPTGTVEKYVSFYYDPIFNAEGGVSGIFVSANDITEIVRSRQLLEDSNKSQQSLNADLASANEELKRIQLRLEETNSQLVRSRAEVEAQARQIRRLFMSAPAGICILDGPDFRYELVNPIYQGIFPGRELLGKTILEALPEMEGHPLMDVLKNVYASGETYEGKEVLTRLARNEGSAPEDIYWNFIYQARRNEFDQIDGTLVFCYEITEEVFSRKKVEESEKRFQTILETMAEGVGITDKEGRLVYVNRMAQEILDIKEAEMLALSYADPKWRNLRLDGTPLPAEEHPIIIALRTGELVFDKEMAIQPPDKGLFYISMNAAPLKDDEGNIKGGIGTFTDVSQKIKAVKVKDEFISTVSHELKTPVTSIKAYAQILARALANTKESSFLERMSVQINRLEELIKDLLDIARVDGGKLHLHQEPIGVHIVLAELIKDLQLIAPTHQLIIKENEPTIIYTDKNRLMQVITNLINNAIKYSPGANKVYINLKQCGSMMVFSVRDFGVGISNEQAPYVFERFHQVSSGANNLGLGLGLYISKEIINKSGGRIWFESEEGKGTTFFFSLPLYNKE